MTIRLGRLMLLVSLAVSLAAEARCATPQSAANSAADTNSFEVACDKATQLADELEGAQADLDDAQREKNRDAKRIAELQAAVNEKQEQAFGLCQRAIELADPKANVQKLNLVRYMLCYFHYAKKNYYDAAVIGEFLARKYPDSEKARQAAQIALYSLDVLYRQRKQAGDANPAFETGKLTDLAEFIVGRWPDQPEAGPAAELLMQFAIAESNFEKVHATLERIPEDSPARAEAEMRMGHALWSRYLRVIQQARQQKSVADDPKTKQELLTLLQQAQQTLERGVAGLRKQEAPSERALIAVLSLVQLYVNNAQANKAVPLLEDSKLGALPLLKKNHPAMRSDDVQAEIHRTAALAYLAADPQQVDKAMASMDALDRLYAKDPDAAARLSQLWVSSAAELKQQLDEAIKQGDAQKQAQLAKVLDKLLSRILERGKTTDFNTLSWVAGMYETLSDRSSAGNASLSAAELSPSAKAYIQTAVKAYEDILSRASNEPDYLPADKAIGVKLRLALDYRTLADFDKATARMAEILKQQQTLLSVQVEAARTYQMRGAVDKPEYLIAAIQGGGTRGDTANIWGWGKLANKTAREPRFSEIFHDARYNIAVCHQLFAKSLKNADDQRKQLEMAKDSIRDTKQFESTLGGEKRKEQYDKLLRELQKALGQPVIGLSEFDVKSADASAPDGKK